MSGPSWFWLGMVVCLTVVVCTSLFLVMRWELTRIRLVARRLEEIRDQLEELVKGRRP